MPPLADQVELVRTALLDRTPEGRVLGDDTNFFEAGLTSSLLAGVLGDLAGAGVPLRLIDLFRFPTLRTLGAELLRRGMGRTTVSDKLPWDQP